MHVTQVFFSFVVFKQPFVLSLFSSGISNALRKPYYCAIVSIVNLDNMVHKPREFKEMENKTIVRQI